jgi:alcohol dehydrogenase (cytochrome c)
MLMRTKTGRRLARLGAISAAIVISVALAACGGSSHKKTSPAAANWPDFGNTSNNTRYSSLNQISSSNVSKLGIAWAKPEGSNLSSWESYPIVVDGTMYLTTDADEVEALNAATGAVKWTYTPKVDFYLAVAGGGGGVPTNRGVAVANGKVYVETFDDKLIALQQATGEKLWQSQIANANQGYSETAVPTVYNGTVYVGSAESDAGLRGFVAAYDANTGAQKWRFYTVPAPGHGWMPAVGQHGGGDVWMPLTVDTTNNTVYFGTGNPSPDLIISDRKGCDPYVDSTVALNATTGALKWVHQEVCPDAWDYDTHQNPMIFDLTVGGKTIQAVGNANKAGFYTVMNAQTGAVISKSPYLVPYTTPHPLPTPAGVNVCPGAVGGIEWSPASFSPSTNSVYQNALEVCMHYTSTSLYQADLHKSGQIDFGGTFAPLPTPKPYGELASIDPTSGKINWETKLPKPSIGGTMSTAGGLVFTGDDDGNLYAANASTGKILWKGDLGLPYGSAPITYKVGNTQYVAVVAGGSDVAAITATPTGGELVVFKLGGSPVHTYPAVSPLTSGLNQSALPNLGHYQKISPFVYVDDTDKKAVVKVIAADTANNAGFNFDGYSKGQANFVVPIGWSVDVEFSNKSATPHNMALTANLKTPVTAVAPPPLSAPVAIPGPMTLSHGLSASDGTVVTGFYSDAPGKYYLVCGVPGHLQAGMWDHFTFSKTAKQPSIEVK